MYQNSNDEDSCATMPDIGDFLNEDFLTLPTEDMILSTVETSHLDSCILPFTEDSELYLHRGENE